jgi:hypothetical protein
MPNSYAILGHSFHTNKGNHKMIPNKVHLYMASKCGHIFSLDNERELLSKNNLFQSLEHFGPGNKYNNQEISIGPRNSLYYGVYKLPNNIRNPRGASIVNTSEPRRIPLSKLLNIISNKTNNRANVIGIFCRNIAHFGKGISYAKKRGKRAKLELEGNEYNAKRYTSLRAITEKRIKIHQAMQNIKNVMKRIPKGRKN